MNWELLISVLSVLIAGFALIESRISRRKAERSARDADAAAGRSAAAAERSAEAAEKSADALERSAQLAEAEAALMEQVTWELNHFQGDSYVLRNVSRVPAYAVVIDLGDMSVARGELEHDVIHGEGFAKFGAVRTLATSDDTVTVTWLSEPAGTRPDQARRVWRAPLPAKQ